MVRVTNLWRPPVVGVTTHWSKHQWIAAGVVHVANMTHPGVTTLITGNADPNYETVEGVTALVAGAVQVGTYPKCHAQMLAKVPKMSPKYPKPHAHMLMTVPRMPPKCPKRMHLVLILDEP
jgi:hypothetical protein